MQVPVIGGVGIRVGLPTLVAALALLVGGLTPLQAQVPNPAESGSEESDVLVTLQVEDKPVQEVVAYLRERSGVNIVIDDDITSTVTVDLVDVSWRHALRIATEKAGCTLVQVASNIWKVEQPEPVSFEFTGADIKEVIDAIGKVSGASIIVGRGVEGPVHLRVNDVPWRAALEEVAKTMGYVVLEEAYGIYRVVDPADLVSQMVTKVFPIRYLRPDPPYKPKIKTEYADARDTGTAAAGDVTDSFTLIKALKSIISDSGSLEYFETTNTVVVKDIPPVVAEIEQMISELDVEPAQVFIDVKFITTSNTDALNYGIDIGETGLSVGLSGGAIPSRLPFSLGSSGWNNSIIASDPAVTPGLSDEALASAIQYGTLDFTGATFVLELLQNDEDSRVVQAPKLLALDNQEATIFVGRTIRFAETEASSNQSGGLTFSIAEAGNSPVQTGFQLYLMPHVIPGTNKVMMTVIPEAEQLVGRSSDPNLQGFQIFTSGAGTPNEVSIALPQVSSSTLVTTLMLESGQTAVIGGLITEQEAETVRKLPFLGDIPVLGWMFKSERKSYLNEALLIFITPRILRDSQSYERFIQDEASRRQRAIETEMERIFGVGGTALEESALAPEPVSTEEEAPMEEMPEEEPAPAGGGDPAGGEMPEEGGAPK